MTRRFADAAETEAAFYTAFAHLDLSGMSTVWANLAETLCVHPGGPLLQGKEAVMESWREILSGVEPPSLRYRTLQRFEDETLAVHLVEEIISPSGRGDREPTRVLATNLYRPVQGSWRLVAHLASLPLAASREVPPAESARLH